MAASEPVEGLPHDFSGTVRLFPLPNLVMFPHVVQSLHVFEPRYRELLEDALAQDQLITMALLQPGWEADYDKRPPVFPVTCVGRVLTHSRLEDGCYNILLLGLRRASVIRELPAERSYRRAEVRLLEDRYPSSSASRRLNLRRELLDCFKQFLPKSVLGQQSIQHLFGDQLSLGVLTDIMSFTVQFDLPAKQQLLSEWNVALRAEKLLKLLRDKAGEQPRPTVQFPPDFSQN